MRFLAAIMSVILISVAVNAQNTWTELSGAPWSNRYDDIAFGSITHGWAVESYGKVYHTSDEGNSWELQFTSTVDWSYLRAVTFIDDQTGFVGSLDSVHFKTNDGGITWEEFQLDIPGPTPGICGLSHAGEHVFGVGAFFYPAYFFRSTDSGSTWEYFDMSAYADGLVACQFISEEIGFIGGIRESEGSVILKTTNGGDTWTEVYSSEAGSEYAWKLFFTSPMIGYASLESFGTAGTFVAKTTDGGDNWERLTVSETQNFDIQGIGFIDENTGWVSPRYEPLYLTTDGGATWSETEGPPNINRIILAPNGELFASGDLLYRYDESVGLAEINDTFEHGLEISPNPTESQVKVSLDLQSRTNVILGLYTLDGRLLEEIDSGLLDPGPRSYSLDMDAYKAGNYLIFLRTNEGFQNLHLVKH